VTSCIYRPYRLGVQVKSVTRLIQLKYSYIHLIKGLIGPKPLQFFKFSDLPLQFTYSETSH
jgi:hypothetical protein